MKRNEKIELLQLISKGQKSISDLKPKIFAVMNEEPEGIFTDVITGKSLTAEEIAIHKEKNPQDDFFCFSDKYGNEISFDGRNWYSKLGVVKD